jgi:hypothetical protein
MPYRRDRPERHDSIDCFGPAVMDEDRLICQMPGTHAPSRGAITCAHDELGRQFVSGSGT